MQKEIKSSVVVKAMLICQEFRFSSALSTLLSNQIYVLHFCLIICETVAVKIFNHFLLVGKY